MQSKIVIPNPIVTLSRRRQATQVETGVMDSATVFPNYTQIPQLLPIWMWHVIRVMAVGIALGLVIGLLLVPTVTLNLLWTGIVPILPFIFFAAPGFWRNACPLAAVNQTPRLFGFTWNLSPPKWFKQYNYLIAISLFLLIVPARKVIFNTNGPALALLIGAILGTAFIMGVLFKGKSGWCSSICPLLPVQRVYGQTPFITIPNSHCQPCVGCTKNCYDFNPHTAYLADMHDQDDHFRGLRKFFVGMFPGFILAFYLLPSAPQIGVVQLYASISLACLASVGTFFVAESFSNLSTNKVAVLYGALAFNIYYWFNSATLAGWVDGRPEVWIMWGIRVVVLALTLGWIYRTFRKEKVYIDLFMPEMISGESQNSGSKDSNKQQPQVHFKPDNKQVAVKEGRTLLDIAEEQELNIEAGCRMGVCGADPICVVKGMENLSKVNGDERNTLQRLGLGENTRLACMAKVKGDVTVSLKCDNPEQFTSSLVQGFNYNPEVKRVVIIGNGIAGVTAADHIRRRHPTCHIDLIGREPHHLYNRMAITRLIYGRSAMQGLYLMPEKWYTDLNITTWLNTQVTGVDVDSQTVNLGTGDTLSYDRLILTTGGNSFIPPIEGYGQSGTFVLRTAEDAMKIRAFVQQHRCQQAVIAGGGLLGLEAAYALHKLGVQTTVLERSEVLLKRQLDEAGAAFLLSYLESLGITILTSAETESVQGDESLKQVTLKDGRTLPADIFLVCVGIRSEATLAKEMGLTINNGILVDAQMQTSLTNIYAAGDAAEYEGKVPGLWATAVGQAEVAAANVVGGDERYEEIVPVTMLKVVGIDLTSIGRFQAEADDQVIAFTGDGEHRYRKLVINQGKIVGAILIGYPDEARSVAELVKGQVDVSAYLADLQDGNWAKLVELAE